MFFKHCISNIISFLAKQDPAFAAFKVLNVYPCFVVYFLDKPESLLLMIPAVMSPSFSLFHSLVEIGYESLIITDHLLKFRFF